MTLFDRISAAFTGFATGGRRATVPDWADWIMGHPFIPPEVLDDDFREAFRKVPMVAAAIGRVQHDVASLPWHVWQGEGPGRRELMRKDGNLVDLLKKANPRDTGYQLRAATVGALKTYGNAYWFLQRFPGSGREPRELWHLPAHLMEVVPGPNRGVNSYWFNRGGQREQIAPEDIIHFRKYNPDDQPVGMSELEPVRRVYQAQFYAGVWLKEFMRKGGMVAGVWTVKDGGRKLTDNEIEAIISRLKRLHVGYNKAWDPVVIDSLEFVRRGMTLSEMELDKQLAIMNADLCRAIGVPPWMMGIKEGGALSTGANIDHLDYTLGTLKREATLIDATINEELCPLFGPGLEVETDFNSTLAIQGALLEQAKGLVFATGRAVMTANEARMRIGLEPHADPTADELFVRTAPSFGGLNALGGLDTGPGSGGTAAAAQSLEDILPGFDSPRRNPVLRQARLMIDGNTAREELRRVAASSLIRHQGRFEAMVRGRLGEQQATALARLSAQYAGSRNGKATRLAIDLDGLMDNSSNDDKARARKLLEQLLSERGAEAVAELQDLVQVAEQIEINMQAERVQRFLTAQQERAITVPDGTTAAALRQSLQEGIAAGESLADLTARVRSVFETRQNMAPTIARTETVPGYNLATQEAWIASGVVDQQEWLTARDDQVREAHAAADGERQAMGDNFQVGGELLEYPGDPQGSAGNVINCRCTLVPIVNDAASSAARWSRFWRQPAALNGHAPENRMRQWLKVPVR